MAAGWDGDWKYFEGILESAVLAEHPWTSLCFPKGSFILVPLPGCCFYLFLSAKVRLAEEIGVCCLTVVLSEVQKKKKKPL